MRYTDLKYAVVGAGKLGLGIIKALLRAEIPRHNIIATVKSLESLERLRKTLRDIKITKNNVEAVGESDVIFLCVKPLQAISVLKELKSVLNHNKLLISTVAGLSLQIINRVVSARIARLMTNIGLYEGIAVTVFTPGSGVTDSDVETVREIFSRNGKFYIVNEDLMNQLTVSIGSLPAHIALMIESLIESNILIGIPQDLSKSITLDIIQETVELYRRGYNYEKLRELIATPGGVTITGLYLARKYRLPYSIMKMIKSSYIKVLEIYKKLSSIEL